MQFESKIHHRRSIRLKDFNYTAAGSYFVTICTRNQACMFGEIADGKMKMNDVGEIVADCWRWLSKQYADITLDEWILMPNHLHGIVAIGDRGGSRTAPTNRPKPLGGLIGAFKTVSTKRINEMCNTPGVPLWQRNYYEHIVRNETDLHRIREYIVNNPMQWDHDSENPVGADLCVALIVEGPPG